MSTISATCRFFLTFLESFTAAEMPSSGNRAITNDQFNSTQKLSAATTPPAAKGWGDDLSGTQTLDLTALARTVGPTVDATGLKLQALLINNLSPTATLNVAKGAANGYAINGAAGDFTIPPGGSLQMFFNDGLADIDATHKTLDLTVTPAGSGTEVEDFEAIFIFG